MSASFTDSFDQLGGDSSVAAASAQPFDDGYLGYDPRLPSQRFDSFSNVMDSDSVKDSVARDSPIFTSQPIPDAPSPPPAIYASVGSFGSDPLEFSSFTPKENGVPRNGSYVVSDGPIMPPPMEIQPEEGFFLRERRRQNAIWLEKKEKREKELLSKIIDEADAYKVEFHRKRQVSCETNKGINREEEKLFLSSREKFHADADKHYWKAISEFIPNEVPSIEKKGKKKDDEKKSSIVAVQGPKPGKPTDLSRMRHIILKLKHDTPAHLKSSPPPKSASTKDAKTGDSISPKVAAMTTSPEAVAVA